MSERKNINFITMNISRFNRHLLPFVFFVVLSIAATAQDIVGTWVTYDDKTDEPMSHVEVYKKNGRLYGKVVKVLAGDDTPCVNCKGDLKGKPVKGMEVFHGLTDNGTRWTQKKGVFDPNSGYTVDGEVWLSDKNTMKVKGKIGLLSVTQTWKRLVL